MNPSAKPTWETGLGRAMVELTKVPSSVPWPRGPGGVCSSPTVQCVLHTAQKQLVFLSLSSFSPFSFSSLLSPPLLIFFSFLPPLPIFSPLPPSLPPSLSLLFFIFFLFPFSSHFLLLLSLLLLFLLLFLWPYSHCPPFPIVSGADEDHLPALCLQLFSDYLTGAG